MSDFITLARPYARAAFEYAREHGKLEHWSKSLALLAEIAKDKHMVKLLHAPKLSRTEKAKLLIRVAGDELDKHGENFVHLLAENGRLHILAVIAQAYEDYRATLEGSVDATVVSAHEVSDEQKQSIIASLEKRLGKKVSLDSKVDPSLIGGAIIKAGDLVIDGSIKSRLQKLASAMAH